VARGKDEGAYFGEVGQIGADLDLHHRGCTNRTGFAELITKHVGKFTGARLGPGDQDACRHQVSTVVCFTPWCYLPLIFHATGV